jgi:hypothetical protein
MNLPPVLKAGGAINQIPDVGDVPTCAANGANAALIQRLACRDWFARGQGQPNGHRVSASPRIAIHHDAAAKTIATLDRMTRPYGHVVHPIL